ncbi:DUF4129 domain-containing transglutaminase family protein [Paenibacillus cymbidii]|uniref:DUF4129 domain-containing transglutaminase family protein n=1 Tax=Paenibacillus cymbidii TaxID=1639034 RepID=UPI0010803CDD|nr:transglutaminase domain-containing protein [Paenibacillus cymbidii]
MNLSPSLFKRIVLYDWQYRLTSLLTALFLLQFVFWIEKEDGVWLQQTVTMVEVTLVVMAVLQFVPLRNRLLHGLLQFAVLFVYNAVVMHYDPILHRVKTFAAFRQLLYDNAVQFTPFIWFTLGAWLVYLTTLWAVQVKWRIYVVVIASVLVLAFRDSFSVVVLWNQAAVVIFCGLSMLVVRHFADLKKKNPTGWGRLADYPAEIAVPIVLLLAGTTLLGSLAPDVNNILTDPYTLWKHHKGEAVLLPGKVRDGGGVNLFGIEANATSGYSRDDDSLGGGFDFDSTEVMTVDTTHRSYWRGETRSFYNGTGWELSDVDKQNPITPVQQDKELAGDVLMRESQLKTIDVTQTVTMVRKDSFPVLFGAFAIARVENVNGEKSGFDRLQWSSRQAELRFTETRTAKYPQSYTIVSKMPIVDEAQLRDVTVQPEERAQLGAYLQLPNTTPLRVRQLAQQITQQAATMYDKAKAIEQYLQMNYTYTNKPDESKARSKDFVDRFLFETKMGYCDYYSSAMVVLARAVGIPARWVKGYAPGVAPVEEDLARSGVPIDEINPDGAGVYSVRNSDAHSWVEVFYPGYGWIPFEPTSGFAMPSAQEVVTPEPIVESTVDPVETTPVAEASTPIVTAGRVGWGVAAVAVVVAAVLLFLYRRPLRRWYNIRFGKDEGSNLNARVVADYNRLVKYTRRKGYAVLEHETARETVGRWKRKDAWLAKDIELLLALFEKAKYSNRAVTPEEATRAATIVRKLREEL